MSNGFCIMARSTKPTDTKPTTQPELPANPQPTLTPEALQALLAEVASQKAEIAKLYAELTTKPEKPAANGKSEQSTKNDLAAIRAFKKAGYGVLVPHKDIMTFNRWVEVGMRPSEGSHSIKVQNLRLFCRQQCSPLSKDEAKAFKDKAAGKPAKTAKVVPINSQAEIPF
jgi:hypothetical protein